MIDYLFDTNIVIYLTQAQERYVEFARRLDQHVTGISVITYMEVLVGAEDALEHNAIAMLGKFVIVPMDVHIARAAVETLRHRPRKSLKDPFLPDILIAHTALHLGVPLVTNNPGDFTAFAGLELVVP